MENEGQWIFSVVSSRKYSDTIATFQESNVLYKTVLKSLTIVAMRIVNIIFTEMKST